MAVEDIVCVVKGTVVFQMTVSDEVHHLCASWNMDSNTGYDRIITPEMLRGRDRSDNPVLYGQQCFLVISIVTGQTISVSGLFR
jgi:hypothetical protein